MNEVLTAENDAAFLMTSVADSVAALLSPPPDVKVRPFRSCHPVLAEPMVKAFLREAESHRDALFEADPRPVEPAEPVIMAGKQSAQALGLPV